VIYNNVFGLRGVPLERCASEIGELLGIDMEERESDYLGRYFLGEGSDFKVQVVRQPDPDGEPLEPEHSNYDVIIYVDGGSRFDSVEGRGVDGSSITRLSA